MKYMITNGNDYISIRKNPGISNQKYICVNKLSLATYFKYQEALNFIKDELNSSTYWNFRKIRKSKSGENYVITTGTNYVTNTCEKGITSNFQKTKWFKSIADAEVYIKKHKKLFDNAIIVDENGDQVKLTYHRKFREEQLKVLGKSNDNKVKRVIIPKTTKEKVYENGHGVCAICGKPVSQYDFTIDHIIPLSRGGNNDIDNLQIACHDCNELKSNRMDSEFETGLATILSNSLIMAPNKEVSDKLIRSIVRGNISHMFPEVFKY